VNKVIPEDTVLDEKSLPMVKMPIGDGYARLPDWKPGTRRLVRAKFKRRLTGRISVAYGLRLRLIRLTFERGS